MTAIDFYMLIEEAGDHYAGWILAELPVLSSYFAVSELNFWTLKLLDHDSRSKLLEINV